MSVPSQLFEIQNQVSKLHARLDSLIEVSNLRRRVAELEKENKMLHQLISDEVQPLKEKVHKLASKRGKNKLFPT
jgi:regulator of replication initiation timing